MTLPRSSRRRSLKAAFVVDDEVEIRSTAFQSSSLYNRGSGAGPPTSSSQGDVDLAEATGPVALRSIYPAPSFDPDGFAFSVTLDKLPAPFYWALKLLGKSFSYKDLELEDDPVFRDRNPSNLFIISTIASYDSVGYR